MCAEGVPASGASQPAHPQLRRCFWTNNCSMATARYAAIPNADKPDSHYATLGVPRDATTAEIRKACSLGQGVQPWWPAEAVYPRTHPLLSLFADRMLALRFHPDKCPDNREEAERMFIKIGAGV